MGFAIDDQSRVSAPGQRRRPTLLWAATAVLMTSLAIAGAGLGGCLLLVGGWLVAAGIHRCVPGLSGPVSWAAGLVVTVSLLVAVDVGVAYAVPRPHGVFINTLVLLSPLLVGCGLLAADRLRPRTGRLDPPRAGLAATLATTVMAVSALIAAQGPGFAVAWTLSGDARNHVLLVRGLLSDGGLTLGRLRSYPAALDAVAAVVAGSSSRADLDHGQLMLHDAQALRTIYVLAVVTMAAMLVAALLQLLPEAVRRHQRLPASAVVVLLIAAASSGSGLALGTALADGFFNAYGTVPIALASIVLALHCCSRPSPAAYALLGPATALTLFGWTLLVVVPASVTVLVTLVLFLDRRRTLATGVRPRTWAFAGVLSLGPVLAAAVALLVRKAELSGVFILPGAITSPETRLLPLLFLISAAMVMSARSRTVRLQMLVPLVVAMAGMFTVAWLASIPGPGFTWTYYATKTLWLLVCCLLWLPFVPILWMVTGRAHVVEGRARQTGAAVWATAWGAVVLLALGFCTTAPSPVPRAVDGWAQPPATIVSRASSAASRGHPFVFWAWSDPGTDRMGNFLAALGWGTDRAGRVQPPDLVGWAYAETGDIHQLCTMASQERDLRVITRAPDLAQQLEAACPTLDPQIVRDLPPS